MILSKRLKAVADLIEKGKVVFDVGSDHALLPAFLVLQDICPKAYAGDNKPGPLARAEATIAKYGLKDRVIPVLADGLSRVEDDVDIITISGMGYYTVEKILNQSDLGRFDKVIVQVNRNVEQLRSYIAAHHYRILDEVLVYEDFYYEIIVFDCKEERALSEEEIIFGPCLLKKKDPLFKEYLKYHLNKLTALDQPKYLKRIEQIKAVLGSF